jgi:DNA repair photolyase
LRSLSILRGHGIQAGVFACPVLPLINDSLEQLRAVGKAASQAGALYFSGNTVFLKPCAKQVFFPFLDQHFPKLADRYRQRFQDSDFLRGLYPEAVRERVIAVRKEFHLARSPEEYSPPEVDDPQMSLF